MSIRPVKMLLRSKLTVEGAGAHLRRAFGFGNINDFDPFLRLDDFRNDEVEDYLAASPGAHSTRASCQSLNHPGTHKPEISRYFVRAFVCSASELVYSDVVDL